jgi:7-carboxy-7-deazaguanine synthase
MYLGAGIWPWHSSTMSSLWISETFLSIQGEGLLAGVPSLFIRTSGCNLRCHFCDTPYTSWEATGEQRSLASLLAWVDAHPHVRHVVVTGGEPVIAVGIEALIEALQARDLHITVETAGTVWKPLPVDLWSISPKLASSAPRDDAQGWRARHLATRYAPEVLRAMMGSTYQLKFVAGSLEDLDDIAAIVADLGAARDRVLVMPEAISVEALDETSRWLVPAVIARGFRYCDRLHIRLFGHTRGT